MIKFLKKLFKRNINSNKSVTSNSTDLGFETTFCLNEKEWSKFNKILNKPPKNIPLLKELFNKKSKFSYETFTTSEGHAEIIRDDNGGIEVRYYNNFLDDNLFIKNRF